MNFFRVLLITLLLSSCSVKDYLIQTKPNIEKDNKSNSSLKDKKLEITISCGKGSIDKLISEGWVVKRKYSEEKICSWKSVPANNKCDMELDKGCKITKPDKIGEEVFYLLEKF
tara:strand:- start:2402 stop:2743 length:342 start_codon:yes stop_codon:yes gene_type:complete